MLDPKESLVKYESGRSVDQKAESGSFSDILNSILPPRELMIDGRLVVQYVSSAPGGSANLKEELDKRLRENKARETGLCPIREELYAQAFDEIIRQATVACSERGLLLLRVRDETRQTIASYQTLYESSIAFAMRKALSAQYKKKELQEKIESLRAEKSELESQVENLQRQKVEIKEREDKRKEKETENHEAEVAKYRKINDQLKANLENILKSHSSN